MTDLDKIPMDKSYPTIKQSFFYLLVMLVLNIVISLAILGIAAGFTKTITQNTATLLIGYVIVFTLATLYGWRRAIRLNSEQKLFTIGKTSLAIFVISFITTIALLFVLDPIVNLIPMPDWLYEAFAKIMGEQSLSAFVMLCLAAPILEELIFRGIILQGFLKNYSPKKAIIWSAILFGLVHLNPWQFIPAVVLGIFIGWVYWKTRSLFPGIFIHFIANTTSYVSSLFIDIENAKELTTQDLIGNNIVYFSLFILALFIIISSIGILNSRFSKNGKTNFVQDRNQIQ